MSLLDKYMEIADSIFGRRTRGEELYDNEVVECLKNYGIFSNLLDVQGL